jgi:hypothetical protein
MLDKERRVAGGVAGSEARSADQFDALEHVVQERPQGSEVGCLLQPGRGGSLEVCQQAQEGFLGIANAVGFP